jgi:hypothetical protein
MYVCMYACIARVDVREIPIFYIQLIYIYIYTHTHIYVYIDIYTYTQIFICGFHLPAYITGEIVSESMNSTMLYKWVNLYAYTHKHTHTHTHTYADFHMRLPPPSIYHWGNCV